jgi:hypothetical protein
MEGLLARLQHASLGKQELFEFLMNVDLSTLDTIQVPVVKEEKIYNEDATLMETIVIHPMADQITEPKEPLAEPKELLAEPKELLAEPKEAVAEPTETIEQIIFYPEVGSQLPTILCPSVAEPLPPIPSMNTEPPMQEQMQVQVQEQVQEQEQAPVSMNIMESLFNLKKTAADEKVGPHYTCQACHRVFKRPHLLSHHHELSLSCSQQLARDAASVKGIHQLVHDCLNRAVKEDDKQECIYCKAPLTTKESQRAHFQGSSSCNRLALDAFKQMILAL